MEFNDIKEGTELFSLIYWNDPFGKSEREMKKVIVKKNRGYYVTLKNGITWSISKNEFNEKWFLTKKECYEKALECHKTELENLESTYQLFKREIRYLNKKIKNEVKNGK